METIIIGMESGISNQLEGSQHISDSESGIISKLQPSEESKVQPSEEIKGEETGSRQVDSDMSAEDEEEEQDLQIRDQSQSQGSKKSNMSVLSDGEEYYIEDQEKQVVEEIDQDEQENVRLHIEDEENIEERNEEMQKREKESKFKGEKMKINLRNFQATLIENSRDRNSIIYLPTGTGKTRIAICSMYYYLCKYGTSKKIVFLANTIQLVKQQAEAIKQTLSAIIQNEGFAKDLRQKLGGNYIQVNWSEKDLNNQVICVHGERSEDPSITKRKRIEAYLTTKKQFLNEMKKATVTVMISQMFLNCLRRGYIKLTDYSFVVFDECHHCGGDHPYSGIMKEFYFEYKKKIKDDERPNRLREEDRLPILMGLTASPVSQPENDYQKLSKELKNLCVNLDSNFSYYPFGDQIANRTQILIEKVAEVENSHRQLVPDLIDYFDRFKQHSVSLGKLKIHFNVYYECVKKVIDLMSVHECLRVDMQDSKIVDPELYLFYDIKDCLLVKLRELWLELGEFAFALGFHKMNLDLSRLTGLRNQENTKLLEQIKAVLKHYDLQFKLKYGRCQKEFMSSKLVRLIEILQPLSEQDKLHDKVNDMVLVFAFKRRTVNYLQYVLQKYIDELPENEKKFYKSVGVTGYAGSKKMYRLEDGYSFQSNPSAEEDELTISKFYSAFVEKEREQLSNRIHLQNNNVIGQNKVLNEEMNRMYKSKMAKMLLDEEEKYHTQIRKIVQFKKREHRVLITTSVTEQGFDIPGCNLVISFDTPFSMKSYIQIKGRARKKNSKYIIFTSGKNYNKMEENKKIYDNTINAIYQLAINHISKEKIDALEKIQYSSSYEKAQTKGGALLNTNYALELLKSYFTSLKAPNRPYFHFIETSNICYKCIIKFPESSTCSKSYVIGKPQPRKEEAMKSAAFVAVKILKKQGFIRDDLRPSRLQDLQDELQMEKYDDLGCYSKDNAYKQIFDQYVQIDECNDQHSHKKLIRFYFKSIEPQKFEFHNLNRNFDYKKFEGNEEYHFQIYLVKFSNKINTQLLNEGDSVNEIGILTCFEKEETEEIFARFRQHLEHSCNQEFELRLVEKSLTLTKAEYEKFKIVHNFLLEGQKSIETDYYNYLNNSPPILLPQWSNTKRSKRIQLKIDQNRQYFPLMVLLRRYKEEKNILYHIDKILNKKIIEHIELFKKIYNFHNKPAKHSYDKPFQQNLTNHYKLLIDTIQGQDYMNRKHLLQCISNQTCFNKQLLTTKVVNYNKEIEVEEENRKKNKLKTKHEKMKKQFVHFREEKDIYHEQVVKLQPWKTAKKEDLNQILGKEIKIKKIDDQKGLYRFLKEFVLYPISYPTMLRVALISKYVFQVFEDYSVALYFRKFYLSEIFASLKPKIKAKQMDRYRFSYYKSVVLDYSDKIFSYVQSAGKSKHLRELGILMMGGGILNFSNLKNDISSIRFNNDQSNDQMLKLNQSSSHILNSSLIKNSRIEDKSFIQRSEIKMSVEERRQEGMHINLDVLSNLKIEDILRALTSKIYKHQKIFNYQEFEFIGDVVLKYLATIQIFLQKTACEQGQMHISRANLICNANLHRAAIRKKLFQYIFTTKTRYEPTPLIRLSAKGDKIKQKKKFSNTQIDLLGEQDDDDDGYQYIPGKVHADVMQALIGIFYLKNKDLNDCQTMLYAFGVLNQPNLYIDFERSKEKDYELPAHLVNIETKLKYTFKHKELLVQALTHPSFLNYIENAIDDQANSFSILFNMNEVKGQNSQILNLSLLADKTTEKQTLIKKHQTFYERMEFLGDSFLDLLVVEYLYDQGGDYLDDEGTLSFLKQSAVSNKTLGFIALKENLQQYLLLDIEDLDVKMKQFRMISKDLDYLPSPMKFSKLKIGSLKILGDVFESLIGAILIDNEFRYEDTKVVVMGLMEKYIKHFTSMSFVEECPTYKYKEYLDQNNYKKYKLVKVLQEGILNGKYMYKLTDKTGNLIGDMVRAANDKDAWDVLLEASE